MSLVTRTPNFLPQTPNKPTTSASWGLLLAQAIDSYGVDSRAIFAEAGLDLDAAQDAEARFPVAGMTRAWQIAVERCNDPCLPLRLTRFFRPGNFSTVGIAVSLSATLLDALRRSVQYARIATQGAVVSLEEAAETETLCVDVPDHGRAIASNYSIEAFMVTLLALLRHMGNADFAPQRVSFEFSRSVGAENFRAYFACPVAYSQPATRLVFDRHQLERAHSMGIAAAARALDAWMADYLLALDSDGLQGQVKSLLMERLAQGNVELKDVARQLALSPRSLQRKLAEQGGNFAKLKDDCRRQLAQRLVLDGKLALAEIAFVLGFADQSAFTRSFRRWTGDSPRRFVLGATR